MGKCSKKILTYIRLPELKRKKIALVLTDDQRRLLDLLATGIEGEEPTVLAGRR